MTPVRPQGKLTLVESEVKDNGLAVFAFLTFEDEVGKRWKMRAATFRFDLEMQPSTDSA